MDNYKIVLRLFRSWAILNYPETDLDIIIEDFENEYTMFKEFHKHFNQYQNKF